MKNLKLLKYLSRFSIYIGVFIKSLQLRKFLYFRQTDAYETFAPAVFDYEDSKFESWHRAKKKFEKHIRSTNRPEHFVVIKIVFISATS